MSWEAWATLAVMGLVIVALARGYLPPSATLLGAVVVLLATGVLTPQQAFAGFSNPAPITVAALFVLARAVEKTGALQPMLAATLGEGKNQRRTLARLLTPTAAASAFLNNTPIVAMLVPQVTEWAQRRGQSQSRYLLPLSYAAVLGGVVTAIGTSTNLVVSGLLEASGEAPLGMFELSAVGLPLAVGGVILLVLLAPVLLPERRPARQDLERGTREFVVGMDVETGGPLDGVAVEAGGLRSLRGVFLVEIERDGEFVAPVSPTTVLRGGDMLTFVGRADLIVDLQATRGLASSESRHLAALDTTRHTFFEVVLGRTSPLVGRTLKEAGFRGRYQAAVVAIHRAGQRVEAKLGSVPLRVGDTLLLLSDPEFRDRWRDRNDFLLVAKLGGAPPTANRKAGIVAVVAAVIVGGAALGLLPILHLSLLGAIALVVFGVLTPGEARSAVDMDVILVIAAAFGLGAALEVTGLATYFADVIVGVSQRFGAQGVLVGIVLATMALKNVISNNATAVLMFPIALEAAREVQAAPRAFAVAVALAASASFLTPIAYQTNLMVYGPGGYRFSDYARLGLPLIILFLLGIALIVPRVWT